MAEEREDIAMEELGNKQDNSSEKRAFDHEEALMKTIKDGNVDDITDKLTPRALTKCHTNALMMAMKVNFELRRLANKKGPDEDEFTKLANSVDEFTTCLLDPLKSHTEDRRAFGDSLDDVIDAGISLEQKKFFAHPVMYNLMNNKWWGTFGRMKRSSWLDLRWKWFLLNLWCLLDIVLFPVLFAVFYIKHRVNKRRRLNRETEIAFVMNATSEIANEAFDLMKESTKYVMYRYKNQPVKYQLFVHGEDSSLGKINFDSETVDLVALSDTVDQLTRGTEEIPALHEDLEKVCEAFKSSSDRQHAEKVLIFFTDHKTCLKSQKDLVKEQVKKVKVDMGIKLVPVGIGSHINIRELERINNDGRDAIHFGEYENPKNVGKKIMHELRGKDLYESYLEYFTTPYFVFLRDTLSYLALLALHFAFCLETSSIPFSGLEWAIFVFFLGRILMEFQQLLGGQTRETGTKQKGTNYKHCAESEEETELKITDKKRKAAIFVLRLCNKYLSDRWNILDLLTQLVYLVTFLLRIVTWTESESIINNRALVIAGYLYGLNTMFLTLRAFGHVMETVKKVGPIQIALFHIIGDVATIFWQFLATILAFSIAITKVYMAERSFLLETSSEKSACQTSGLACWWSMVKHLCWSLLGIAELDPLDSVDSPSVTLVHFLYGAFLVMGVILLVNMMIALLSNTYQRVEDNALKEWSYKKAITIQTYSTYHPIPVPLNLISNLFLCIRWLWWMCKTCCKAGHPLRNTTWKRNERGKSLDAVVENLQLTYFAKYGYSFPLTDERKMDHVLQETERNRQMANQIAHRTFTTHGFDDGAFPTGPKAWQSQGIRIEGCLLICEGSECCSTCKDDPSDNHGARYLFPFSPETPHFEVLIQETGERRFLGVGVVGKNYGNHAMPGWLDGTVGYHIDDGKIFINSPDGNEYDDAMAYRGDVIGCTVKFELASNGKIPVVFSLNGRQITQDEILMEYTPNEKSLFPYIAMGHVGIRVLAKMRSNDTPHVPSLTAGQDERQRERELIMKILEEIKKFKLETHKQVEKSEKLMESTEWQLMSTASSRRWLQEKLARGFESIRDLFRRSLRADEQRMSSPALAKANLMSLIEKDESYNKGHWPTNTELLTKISDELAEIGKYTADTSGEFLERMESLKTDAEKLRNGLNDMDSYVEKEFSEVKELIRKNCTKYKEEEDEEDKFLASIGVIRT
ncbi:uncharacterized protein LOC144656151 isoform X2 [Oculina patagonica]